MADKYQGPLIAGSTSNSVTVLLRSATDGSEIVGKVAADMTAAYWRQGGSPTSISLSDLSLITSAYSSGGVKEASSSLMPGAYRLDLPDAAVAAGVEWVQVAIKVTGSLVFQERYPIASAGAGQVNTLLLTVQTAVTAIKAKTDQLAFTVANKVDSTIQLAGDFAQAAADKVWSSATRMLTAFGFTVSLASDVWDEVAASHNTAGTMGQKLNAAGANADPLLNAVPGSYAAGTAGNALGALSTSNSNITAIKAQTDQLTFLGGLVQAGGTATSAAIAAAVWATVVEQQGSYTAKQALSIGLAVLAGVTTNGGTTFKTPDGTVVRVQSVLDAANERITIVLTPSA